MICTLVLIIATSCTKGSDSVATVQRKDHTFDYSKDKTEVDDASKYLSDELYKFDSNLTMISKEEYISDSLSYKNDIDPQEDKFKNNILQTSYGQVKFVTNGSKDSDAAVQYSLAGFSKTVNSFVVDIELYEGEKTVLVNDESYEYQIISGSPAFSPNKKYAVNFKDNEGMSSQISFYHVEKSQLKHFITLWSENYIADHVIWNQNNDLILKLRKTDSGSYSYAKISVPELSSNRKSNSTTVSQPSAQNWKGEYEITTRAISGYDQKEIDLVYTITVTSNDASTLSIGAKQAQDYWCEGDYMMTNENGILHAKGKCDEDDVNDFYLKQENGKYFIKSKRFLDKNWQSLKKL